MDNFTVEGILQNYSPVVVNKIKDFLISEVGDEEDLVLTLDFVTSSNDEKEKNMKITFTKTKDIRDYSWREINFCYLVLKTKFLLLMR